MRDTPQLLSRSIFPALPRAAGPGYALRGVKRTGIALTPSMKWERR